MTSVQLRFMERVQGREFTPRSGAVFSYRMSGNKYLGLVVKIGLRLQSETASLTYFFASQYGQDINKIFEVRNLLLPPQLVISSCWRKELFIAEDELDQVPKEVLPVHCFRHIDLGFVNEYGKPINNQESQCERYGSFPLTTLEYRLAFAAGLVISPAEYVRFPIITNIAGKSNFDVHTIKLVISTNEMTIMENPIQELDNLLLPRLSEFWIESGIFEDSYIYYFEVKASQVSRFIETAVGLLRSRGIRSYKLRSLETDAELA